MSHINPKCDSCKGTGRIRYFFDQDDSKEANCTKCFPDDEYAKRLEASFYRSLGYHD